MYLIAKFIDQTLRVVKRMKAYATLRNLLTPFWGGVPPS